MKDPQFMTLPAKPNGGAKAHGGPGHLATVLSVLVLATSIAWAGQIVQYEPDYTSAPGSVLLITDLINDDEDSVYNSYDLYVFRSLGEQLWALPHNQGTYSNLEALMADWTLSIRADPEGEVNSGWYVTTGDYNPAVIENVGGIPNVTYQSWLSTQENPNQDTMRLILFVPTSQLDGTPTNLVERVEVEE